MSLRSLRVVVVDDHHEWRQHLKTMIENTGAWRVVGEAADGAEACAVVVALKPDLILLDVQLPDVNGIEAATRILAADPSARILFLSGHKDWEVIEAAMLTGARGYVLKSFVGPELLPAMSAVASGRRFLSAAVGGRAFDAAADRHAPHEHQAGFYSNHTALMLDYEAFVADSLNAGKSVVGAMDAQRRDQLLDRLRGRGVDIDRAIAEERYIALDVDTMLRSVIVDGLPNEAQFWKLVIAMMMKAARTAPHGVPAMAVFGDGAQTLWKHGMPTAAILSEQLWNDASKTLNIDLLCGYTLQGLESEDDQMRELIGATHSATRTR